MGASTGVMRVIHRLVDTQCAASSQVAGSPTGAAGRDKVGCCGPEKNSTLGWVAHT